jgi:hypothetical protein
MISPNFLHLPTLRNLAEGGGDAGVVFVAGEAEVHEPLAVKGAGHSLQNLDAPLAVLDEFVVGRQDARDALLDRERGKRESISREEWFPCDNFGGPRLLQTACSAIVQSAKEVEDKVSSVDFPCLPRIWAGDSVTQNFPD